MPTEKKHILSLIGALGPALQAWDAANKGVAQANPGIPVSAAMSFVVSIIRACPSAEMRRDMVEGCIAAMIEETDPGISALIVPCGADIVAAALAEAIPEGNA